MILLRRSGSVALAAGGGFRKQMADGVTGAGSFRDQLK
jgi:hypothetical protein